jgi:hypothetical protein
MPQPSLHYRQHYETVRPPRIDQRTFRQGWTVMTRLDGLLRDKAISAGIYEAAMQFRRDYETGLLRRRMGLMALPGEPSNDDGHEVRRIDALGRLRQTVIRLGAFDARLVEQCVVHDAAWETTGRQLGVTRKTARAWTVAALHRLADLAGCC